MSSFLKLGNELKAKSIYYNDKYFFFVSDSVFYVIDSMGYHSIEDYDKGKVQNFMNGESFYYALSSNFSSQEEVDYFKKEYFITPNDYLLAKKKNLINISDKEKYLGRPIIGLLGKDDFTRLIREINIVMRIWKDDFSMEDKPVEKSMDELIQDSGGAIRYLIDDIYYIYIPYKLNLSSLKTRLPQAASASIIQYGSNRISTATTNKNPTNEKATIVQLSDAFVYYRAMIEKYVDYADLLNFNNLTGYSIQGTKKIYEEKGFTSLQSFVSASGRGFSRNDEYALANEYQIADKAELLEYTSYINLCETIRKTYQLKNIAHAIIIKKILELELGKPMSISSFIQNITNQKEMNKIEQNFLRNRVSPEIIDKLLISTSNINNLIVYDKQGQSFYRK